ncbi:M67 family peptidase [Candidatus Thorarchaeota archaeon]|nr:MAG: M67 family peptidase [Candidatus Thorarchaeota archaeon]
MDVEEIVLTQNQIDALLAHAESWYPKECVALLFGHSATRRAIVSRMALMDNLAAARTTFAVKPEEQYRLLVEAEKRGDTMIGVFHSHPAPVRPSEKDLENMRLNPVVWIVASKSSGNWEYGSFILAQDDETNQIRTSIR